MKVLICLCIVVCLLSCSSSPDSETHEKAQYPIASVSQTDIEVLLPEVYNPYHSFVASHDTERKSSQLEIHFPEDYFSLTIYDINKDQIINEPFKAAYGIFHVDIVDLNADQIPEVILQVRSDRGVGLGEGKLTIFRICPFILVPILTCDTVIPYGPNVASKYNVRYIDYDKNGTIDLVLNLEVDPDDGSPLNSPSLIPMEKTKIISWSHEKELCVKNLQFEN